MGINRATLAKEIDGTIEYIYPKTTADMVDYTVSETVEEKLTQMSADLYAIDVEESLKPYYTKIQVDDLIYQPITINSVSVNPYIAEAGSTQNVTVSWNVSKEPVTLTVDGETVDNPTSVGSKVISGITGSKTIAVVVTDAGKSTGSPATATKNATITFYNPIYYGAAIMATIDDNFVNSLTGKLVQANAKCSFTVNAGANQYIWFACPATNNPIFSVNGFIGGFELASTFNFTNSNGASASYKVFRSQNADLGSTTVTVS